MHKECFSLQHAMGMCSEIKIVVIVSLSRLNVVFVECGRTTYCAFKMHIKVSDLFFANLFFFQICNIHHTYGTKITMKSKETPSKI
jgi:hypothetical protein